MRRPRRSLWSPVDVSAYPNMLSEMMRWHGGNRDRQAGRADRDRPMQDDARGRQRYLHETRTRPRRTRTTQRVRVWGKLTLSDNSARVSRSGGSSPASGRVYGMLGGEHNIVRRD